MLPLRLAGGENGRARLRHRDGCVLVGVPCSEAAAEVEHARRETARLRVLRQSSERLHLGRKRGLVENLASDVRMKAGELQPLARPHHLQHSEELIGA